MTDSCQYKNRRPLLPGFYIGTCLGNINIRSAHPSPVDSGHSGASRDTAASITAIPNIAIEIAIVEVAAIIAIAEAIIAIAVEDRKAITIVTSIGDYISQAQRPTILLCTADYSSTGTLIYAARRGIRTI